ncbi:glycolate oxidase subunit GlcF [Sneathiella chinensis]|uniref:Glycolate oxidase iron-sulfur subunit n=1 Tax=Sneathiella chinensis TaxID=349750 RepID=A0ABQ5U2U5_9PROT|nr:glycolate oxidase subunit GlcF [Sneathiella chinensis]GLQ06497.1 glycolate oxidase iron-sulfur subunit [Sneathiella chinensis]
MKTDFSLAQLADPRFAASNDILRKCVHCGFCTATCPTYVELGDERDSPRGRIYLIQQMLESGEPAPDSTVTHVDRCLSCLSCMTTCPSGVDYMHLVDHARQYIEETHERPLRERVLRKILAGLLPSPTLFRLSLIGAWAARPFRKLFFGRVRAMLEMAPATIPSPSTLDTQPRHEASGGGAPVKRVVLMTGCAQKVLSPDINDATIRLLTRLGVEVIIPPAAGCCGALPLHMGQEDPARKLARDNIQAWYEEQERAGLDAIVINTSGCGTTVKDYGHMFRDDPGLAEKAAVVAGLAKDITEFLVDLDLKPVLDMQGYKVAYHSACSLQHGQKVKEPPMQLLRQAGYTVLPVPEAHLCCGSAGTYNLLQPELSARLKERKVRNIASLAPDMVAAGNIGCITQIASGMQVPVVHTVQLLDWATGGPKPGGVS